MKADNEDQLVQLHRVDFEDILEGETGMGKLCLEPAHGDCVGGIFCLGGKHERDEGLEALILRDGFSKRVMCNERMK